MKMLLIVVAMASGCVVVVAACNDGAGPVAPSTKHVDSVVAAAPDTIKAGPVDSGMRKGSDDTVK